MAQVIFYSTGEIFWVSDPPPTKLHIGVPYLFPPLPPDHLFTYAMAAHALEDAGHTVIGAYGRQRREVRERNGSGNIGRPDPQFLALGQIPNAKNTVLVLIATDSDKRPKGADDNPRIPFTEAEKEAFKAFRSRGGGVYVTWDHGQLGYESLKELGLEGPVEREPEEPLRPNVTFSNDSTGQARVDNDGFKRLSDGTLQPQKVSVSVGPPAGYLQKIVPAELLYQPLPVEPHPIFNGVGGEDGIWIPAHSHEGKLKVRATLRGIDETQLPEGVKTLAVHVPTVETTFISFAVMAHKDAIYEQDADGSWHVKEGAIIWDTSFHHLCDINWSSTGYVPWDHFVPFSARSLWQQQFSPELFEAKMERGIKRLIINVVKWLVGELPGSPSQQIQTLLNQAQPNASFAASRFIDDRLSQEAKQLKKPQNNYPSNEELSTANPS